MKLTQDFMKDKVENIICTSKAIIIHTYNFFLHPFITYVTMKDKVTLQILLLFED